MITQIIKEILEDMGATVPCRLCGTRTRMLGTKLCDPCWELEERIRRAPDIARKILVELDKAKEKHT